MIVMSANNITKGFGENILFNDISFEIHSSDKIGLVGNNGVGKSTLLKIINGYLKADSGQINISKESTLGYLEQQPKYPGKTVIEVLMSVFNEQILVLDKMHELENVMSKPNVENIEKVLERYGYLSEKFNLLGGYDFEIKLNSIKNGFGFSDNFCSLLFDKISGGQKTKVLLAKLLLIEPDILILDEPTNFLDLNNLKWLEEFLIKYKGSVFVVSHDRLFLDNCVNKVYELTANKIEKYDGNYSSYVIEKERRFNEQMKDFEDQQKRVTRMQDQIKWMKSTGSNVLKAKAHQIEAKIDKLQKIEKPIIPKRKLNISLGGTKRSSKRVLEFENVSQGFKEILFENARGTLLFQDSVGIIGDNGMGKTTFLKTILGILEPLDGKIKFAENLSVGYLDQESKFENEEETILENYSKETGLDTSEARNSLAKLMFYKDDVNKKIKVLSGGEKKRLKLAIMIQSKPNLLVLDEPTNHLDLSSREKLEKELADYPGTLLFVSHDRYFLNKIASKIWEVKKDGIEEYNGNYDDYIALFNFGKDKAIIKK